MFLTSCSLQNVGAMASFVFLIIGPTSLLSLIFRPLQSDNASSVSLIFWPTSELLTFWPAQDNGEVATIVIYVSFTLRVSLTICPARDIVVVEGRPGMTVIGVPTFGGAAGEIAGSFLPCHHYFLKVYLGMLAHFHRMGAKYYCRSLYLPKYVSL